MPLVAIGLLIGLSALVFLCLGVILDDRRARIRRRAAREEPAHHALTRANVGVELALRAPARNVLALPCEAVTAEILLPRTRSRVIAAQLAIEDPATVEICSLSEREQKALELATLRCMDGGATVEIEALPEREQEALQIAMRRCADEPAIDIEVDSFDEIDGLTEVEIPSLRVFDPCCSTSSYDVHCDQRNT